MLKPSNPVHLFVCLLTDIARWLIGMLKPSASVCLPVDRYSKVVDRDVKTQ